MLSERQTVLGLGELALNVGDFPRTAKATATDHEVDLFAELRALVAKYFTSSDRFTCISSPSISLAASQVNDDYCDCPDGSDEPGTSACSYISDLSPASPSIVDHANISLALPGFYCINKGHRPGYIPFLIVNDGVCDYDLCCDGSDEWAGVGGIKCENRCKEIGKEWRKNDEQKQKALGQAAKKRKELVADALRLRKEVEARIAMFETQIESSTMKVKELQVALAETEKRERGKVLKGAGKTSKIAVLAGLAKDRIEELRASLVEVRQQRNSAIDRVTELEALLTTFKEEYNPNFNDEGVKRAVRSWEEYAARDKAAMSHEAEEQDLDEIAKSDEDSRVIRWSEWEDPDETDVDVRKLIFHQELSTPHETSTLTLAGQSTKSKHTSPSQSVTGRIRNYEIYEPCW